MPSAVTPDTISSVAIALELPLVPRYLSEVAYQLQQLEATLGVTPLIQIQEIVDSIGNLEKSLSASALKNRGAIVKADDVEFAAIDNAKNLNQELNRLRLKLAKLTSLDAIVSGSQNRISLMRY